MKFQRITQEEFNALKKNDVIYILCAGVYCRSTVRRKPFYNTDTNPHQWEVETNNGFSDMYSIYTPLKKPRFNSPFIDDSEKMLDFLYLSKEDFLESYSYLTEEEYNATVDAVLKLIYPND